MARVLIVEDDAVLNNGIVLSLRQGNFNFSQAFNEKLENIFTPRH